MKELPADLLSAYYDHAVTPAEKEVVEQQLENSATVRRQLEEFERLSELLQELPRRAIPSGFAAEILHGVERQMLLPEPAAAGPRWWSARRRWMAVAGLLSTAAILFVTVQWNPTPIATGPQAMESLALHDTTPALKSTRENSGLVPESNFVSPAENLRDSRAMAPTASAVAGSSDRKVSEESSGKASGNVALSVQPSMPAELRTGSGLHPDKHSLPEDSDPKDSGKDSVASNSRRGRAAVTSGPPLPSVELAERQAGSEPTVGEWLETLAEQGDQVAFVKVGVVDYAAGMQLVQVVLSENSIRQEPAPVPSGGEQAAMKNRAEATHIPPAAGELQVLFVQAESERLAAVIESLQNRKEVVAVQMEPAVAAAGFEVQAQQRSLPESHSRDTNADAFGAAALARKSTAAPAFDLQSLGVQQPDGQSSPQVARQMLLNIPREALSQHRGLWRYNQSAGESAPVPTPFRKQAPPQAGSPQQAQPQARSELRFFTSGQARNSGKMPVAEPATLGPVPDPATPAAPAAAPASTTAIAEKSPAPDLPKSGRSRHPLQVIFVVEQQPTKKTRAPAPAVRPAAKPADGDGAA